MHIDYTVDLSVVHGLGNKLYSKCVVGEYSSFLIAGIYEMQVTYCT